ncbi:thymidylate kinase [Mesotoga sp. Brook.08.YT.4.2.5.1]|mgnify:CR=1 FL=1|jgi:dTMP kinase|uniref:Thymidylate kinase n=2 Tax=Mesotoga TaxID=1184396 RepID=A0A124FYS7_9BACT|nr:MULTISPECIES: dTMP kinase [unclassified Mesotoga]KUK82105.1 MAG: Thymidylate kinase [Mesotoga prima]PNQ05388.1 thymidylate kinase [Mesotoga sp. SC_NapDC3]PXF35700.1 thymidylate kinase [Mesotoga sp. SC_NapDC]RAM60024.1 thymidylate kinase [Mesotoga sp. SC_3PWM13N19]MDD3459690.1 dTMP kinase [Mesotoga sp.]
MFVSIEGIDGCGKTTQIKLLEEYLSLLDVEFAIVREPGGTRAGEEIREILLHKDYPLCAESELLLFMAARAQIVREVIKPALESGRIVIADRFMDSSVAYQGVGRCLGREIVQLMNSFAVADTLPDITLYIDVPADVAISRMRKERKNDKIEVESLEFFERVRKGYEELMAENRERFVVIDGTNSEERVQQDIRKALSVFLGKRKPNGR